MKVDLTTEELITLINHTCFAYTRKENEILQRVHLKFKQAIKGRDDIEPGDKCNHAWVLARTYEGHESICVKCHQQPNPSFHFLGSALVYEEK